MIRGIRWVGGLKRSLQGLRVKAADLSEPLRLFGVHMLRSIARNFAVGGRRQGVPGAWPKLSPVTIAMRPKGQRARPRILVRTANLRNSTAVANDARRLAVGTRVPYAPKHHQDGRWGQATLIQETRRVPAHKVMRWVRPGTKTGIQRRVWLPSLKHAQRLTRNPGRARGRGPLVSPAVDAGIARRAGLVRRAIMVRAHTEQRRYMLRARPIYEFQPEDRVRWGKILKAWFTAKVRQAEQGRA